MRANVETVERVDAPIGEPLDATARHHLLAWLEAGATSDLCAAIKADPSVLCHPTVASAFARLWAAAQQGDVHAYDWQRALVSIATRDFDAIRASFLKRTLPEWTVFPPSQRRRGRRPKHDVRYVEILKRNFRHLLRLLDASPLALKQRRHEDCDQFIGRLAEWTVRRLYGALTRPIQSASKPWLSTATSQHIVRRALRRRMRKKELLYGILGHWLGESAGAIRGLLER